MTTDSHGTVSAASSANMAHGVCPPLTAKWKLPLAATAARARSATKAAPARATASGSARVWSSWCMSLPSRMMRLSATRRQLRRLAARADLGLQRGEFAVHVGGRSGFVELLLDVVGATADVFEHPGLQKLVQRARARLHGGDLVLGSLQLRPRIAQRARDPRDALV